MVGELLDLWGGDKPRSSFQKQRESIPTADSAMGTAWEERLDFVWVSKVSEVRAGWDG